MEEVGLSRQVAQAYIEENLPSHRIHNIAANGPSILHAFLECLSHIGHQCTLMELQDYLRGEIEEDVDHYQGFCVDTANVVHEVRNYIREPMNHCREDITDIYPIALGRALQVNVVVFSCSPETCSTIDLGVSMGSDANVDTIYLVRTESKHYDAVVPCTDQKSNLSSAESEDSDDDLVITTVVEASGSKALKTESNQVLSSSCTNFTDYSDIDFNTHAGEDIGMEDGAVCNINFSRPTADHLIRCILGEYPRYEVSSPVKRCRQNLVYTISNASLDDVSADDNGAYITNTGDTPCVVKRDENDRTVLVQTMGKPKNGHQLVYRQRCIWVSIE